MQHIFSHVNYIFRGSFRHDANQGWTDAPVEELQGNFEFQNRATFGNGNHGTADDAEEQNLVKFGKTG